MRIPALWECVVGCVLGCLLASTLACSTADPAHLLRGEPVELHLRLEQDRAGQPVAFFEFRNRRSYSLAVTRTFGLDESYLRVEIVTRGGVRVPYPASADLDFPGLPRFVCLLPGRSVSVTVPLNGWHILLGGEPFKASPHSEKVRPEESLHSFELGPGFYRIRGVYDSAGGTTGPCLTPVGPFETPWVEFEVPMF